MHVNSLQPSIFTESLEFWATSQPVACVGLENFPGRSHLTAVWTWIPKEAYLHNSALLVKRDLVKQTPL